MQQQWLELHTNPGSVTGGSSCSTRTVRQAVHNLCSSDLKAIHARKASWKAPVRSEKWLCKNSHLLLSGPALMEESVCQLSKARELRLGSKGRGGAEAGEEGGCVLRACRHGQRRDVVPSLHGKLKGQSKKTVPRLVTCCLLLSHAR